METDEPRERKKAERIYQMAQKICPLRQSWGENVPISFEMSFARELKHEAMASELSSNVLELGLRTVGSTVICACVVT